MHICNETDNTLRVLLGTELKIAISSSTVDLTKCEFTVEVFTRPNKRVNLSKADLKPIPGTASFLAVVDSSELGTGGYINVVLTAYIPDSDCADGFRTEVVECIVQNVAGVVFPGSPCVAAVPPQGCRQWLQLKAWLITDSDVAGETPETPETPEVTGDGVLMLNATHQAVFLDDGTLKIGNGAKINEHVLTFN